MAYTHSHNSDSFDDKDQLLEPDNPQEVAAPSGHRNPLHYAAYIVLVVFLCGSNIITALNLIELKVLSQCSASAPSTQIRSSYPSSPFYSHTKN